METFLFPVTTIDVCYNQRFEAALTENAGETAVREDCFCDMHSGTSFAEWMDYQKSSIRNGLF